MEIIFSKRFKKQANKLAENKPNLKIKINNSIKEFAEKKRQADCYRKRLKGEWFGYEELELGGDIRIIFRMNKAETKTVFERIGTHSQLGI